MSRTYFILAIALFVAIPSLGEPVDHNRADDDDAGVLFTNGLAEASRGNFGAAGDLFLRAADLGHADAAYHMGMYYEEGIGIGPSMVDAVEFYRIAADQGHEEANRAIERIYFPR